MAYNREYPYVDAGRMDTDWLINKVRELEEKVAKLKYAAENSPVTELGGFRSSPVPENIAEIAMTYDLTSMDSADFYSLYDSIMEENPLYMTKVDRGMDASNTYHLYEYHWLARVNKMVGRRSADPEEFQNDHYEDISQTWPSVGVLTGIHGDEKMGVIMFYLLFRAWLRGEDQGQYILDEYDFHIMPCGNPWGMHHHMSYPEEGRLNSNGVNLNRNFPYLWEEYTGTNKGDAAADQAETQAIMAFANQFSDNKYRGMLFFDLHDFDYIREHNREGDHRKMWMTSNYRSTRFRLLKSISYIHEQMVEFDPDLEVDYEAGDIFCAWQSQYQTPTFDNWNRVNGRNSHLLEVPTWFSLASQFNTKTFACAWLIHSNIIPGLLDVSFQDRQRQTYTAYPDVATNTYEVDLLDISEGLLAGARFVHFVASTDHLREQLPLYDQEIVYGGILEVQKTSSYQNHAAVFTWTVTGLNQPRRFVTTCTNIVDEENPEVLLRDWQEVKFE